MKKPVAIAVCMTAFFSVMGCSQPQPEAEAPTAIEGLENGSFTADLNGFEIHYEVHGSGPTLMVVPQSWGLSVAGLRGLYRPLEEKLTLVYFDPRGMGESGPIVTESDMGMEAVRADFNALRGYLGYDRVNAIGWSNGAMNLIELAAEEPETIENAIFVHGVASFTEEDAAHMVETYPDLMAKYMAFEEAMHTDTELTELEKTERMRALWFEEWFPLSTSDPDNAPLMFERLFGDAEFSWAHADYNNRATPTFEARDLLPLITARSLVIAGAHDMFAVDKVQELADGITDSQFAVFDSSGHFAPAEETEKFSQMVWRFLGVQ